MNGRKHENTKTRKHARYFCVFVFSVLSVFLFTPSAHAFSLAPARQNILMDPGTARNISLTLQNTDSTPVVVRFDVQGFIVDQKTGRPVFGADDEASKWIQPPAEEMTLTAGQKQDATFTVSVPHRTAPGGHYVALFAETAKPEEAGHGGGSRAGSLIFLNVGGQIEESLVRQDFSSTHDWYFMPPIQVRLRLQNSGNVHATPGGTITLRASDGTSIGQMSLNPAQKKVLPGGNFEETYTWRNISWRNLGQLTAIAEINSSLTGRQMIDTIRFWYIPLPILGIIALAIIGIFTLFVAGRKRARALISLVLLALSPFLFPGLAQADTSSGSVTVTFTIPDQGGGGAGASAGRAQPTPPAVPGAPVIGNVVVVPATTFAEIRWRAAGGVAGPVSCRLDTGVSAGPTTDIPVQNAGSEYWATASGLSGNTVYQYRIRCADGSRPPRAAASNGAFRTVSTDNQPPLITNVRTQSGQTNAVTTWTARDNTGLAECVYTYSLNRSDAPPIRQDVPIGNNFSFRVQTHNLVPDTEYLFRITCFDSARNAAAVLGDWRTGQTPPRCGDGVVNPGEECDGGAEAGFGGSACGRDCRRVDSGCGNGRIESGEACDDGNTRNADGCTAECQWEPILSSPISSPTLSSPAPVFQPAESGGAEFFGALFTGSDEVQLLPWPVVQALQQAAPNWIVSLATGNPIVALITLSVAILPRLWSIFAPLLNLFF